MKISVLLFVLMLSIVSSAVAGQIAVSSPDPFILQFGPNCCGNAPSNKTFSSQSINTGIRNLVIVGAGQSNIGDNAGTAYIPTNGSKIDNMYIYDGAIYVAADPLLGPVNDDFNSGPSNFIFRLADDLITANLFDRVILFPIGVGGSLASDWDTGIANDRFGVAYRRLAAKGITPGLANTTIIIMWCQGEADTQNGTSQAAYSASLSNAIAKSRTAGFGSSNVTWFVAEESWQGGTTSANVQNAQIAAVNHGSNIWAGPNSDAFNGNICGAAANAACRRVDNTHWSPSGAYTNAGTGGGGWRAALHAFGAPF